MDFTNNSLFETKLKISSDIKIIFVADLFVEDYVGGAELTSEALIQSSPFKIYKLHSKLVSIDLLRENQDKFWIFGNFSQMDLNLIPTIMANMRYSVLEYDYKYCRYRSTEKHQSQTGKECDCDKDNHGKLISGFYRASKHIWWMSEKQMEFYHTKFPILKETNNTVLSSVFDNNTLAMIKLLRTQTNNLNLKRNKWIILGSNSWIKGFEDAKKYCEDNNLDYEVVWNLPYKDMLIKLSQAKGVVYLPRGKDTCPRLCLEMALLGGDVIVNDNVQNASEEWCKDFFTIIDNEKKI